MQRTQTLCWFPVALQSDVHQKVPQVLLGRSSDIWEQKLMFFKRMGIETNL